MKTAIAYCRVSTLQQSIDGTIEQQKLSIDEYAGRNQYNIIETVKDDGVSGADKDRAMRLIQFLRQNSEVDAFIVTTLDRLARDLYLQLFIEKELLKLGIELIAVHQDAFTQSNDPLMKAMRQIIGVFAELEKSMIVTRLKNGRDYKKNILGIRSQGTLPFGYRYGETYLEGHGQTKSIFTVPEEVAAVKEIFKMAGSHYCSNPRAHKKNRIKRSYSAQQSADNLNEKGLKNSRGQEWNRSSVRTILLNRFYAGFIGKKAKGSQPVIIPEGEYNRVLRVYRRS